MVERDQALTSTDILAILVDPPANFVLSNRPPSRNAG
ncbi:MAG: hypothetical protein IGNPGNKH_00012 [Sodalis sp. Ffu]|nr:MAG: hypothetical protein IGNPGNKH_00012 [Sodalis sp. Ffu]